MDPMGDRSKDVTTASTATLPAAAARALDFDALYRDARDDVFAYTATLLRDSAAAEGTSNRTKAERVNAIRIRPAGKSSVDL